MSIDIDPINRRFRLKEQAYRQLEAEGLFILERSLEDANIKLHSLTSRIKTFESFMAKAKRKQLRNPIDEIQDVVGIRVVCLFVSDIDRIGELIKQQFEVLNLDDRIMGSEASSFGYMSVHFDVIMKKEHTGPRYDPIAGLAFEIQVRTIAMDAWANVSHYLDYKNINDVPSELKKDFYALSGLFYVADRHFEIFYEVAKMSRERMEEFFEEAGPEARAEQEINLDSLTAYLGTKLPERPHSDVTSVSQLVNELLRAGYKSIGDVDRLLDSASEAFARYEEQHRPFILRNKFADVGVVRTSARIANDEYLRQNSGDLASDSKTSEYAAFKEFLK